MYMTAQFHRPSTLDSSNDFKASCKTFIKANQSSTSVLMDDFQKDWLDRNSDMRCPWQDIGSSVVGLAASDAGRHFIERWNSHMYYCFKSAVKLSTPGLRRFRIPAIAEAGFQITWWVILYDSYITVWKPHQTMAKQIIVPRQLAPIVDKQNQMNGNNRTNNQARL